MRRQEPELSQFRCAGGVNFQSTHPGGLYEGEGDRGGNMVGIGGSEGAGAGSGSIMAMTAGASP